MFEITGLELEIVGKLLLAALLGGVIGLEREIHKSPAGIKTYSIVAVGSALFTLSATAIDISVAGGVITGIGFLGAATVFKSEDKIYGLTTASLIWSTSAIGFAIGIGYYFAPIITTAIIMIILLPVEQLEKKLLKRHIGKNE
jgi:putative Mg2+ transporter-C (MgtC) family protein